MDISVTIKVLDQEFSAGVLRVLFEGTVSQNFNFGPSSYFMSKNR